MSILGVKLLIKLEFVFFSGKDELNEIDE